MLKKIFVQQSQSQLQNVQMFILKQCVMNLSKNNVFSINFKEGVFMDYKIILFYNYKTMRLQQIIQNFVLPSCGSSTQSCFKSQSSNAICKNGDIIQQPENCISVLKRLQICEENIAYNNNFTCSNIKKTDQQPSLCAKAMDDCRFNSQYCVSEMPIKNKDNTYNCDPSFSKSLCEKCGCDYTYLGYCQQNRQTIQINQDGSNQYYLCYLVNMLKSSFKPQACGSLSQACRYITECEDATHFIDYIKINKLYLWRTHWIYCNRKGMFEVLRFKHKI